MKVRSLALLGVVLGALSIAVLASARQVGTPRVVQKVSLETHLEGMVGANALDCGRHSRSDNDEAAMTKSLKCGLDAAMSGKAFRVIRDEQGIDSQIAYGLLSKEDGKILYFEFDSAPCGGPGCPSRFQTRACPSPAVGTSRPGRFTFVCK
jgi:hypothetical protein